MTSPGYSVTARGQQSTAAKCSAFIAADARCSFPAAADARVTRLHAQARSLIRLCSLIGLRLTRCVISPPHPLTGAHFTSPLIKRKSQSGSRWKDQQPRGEAYGAGGACLTPSRWRSFCGRQECLVRDLDKEGRSQIWMCIIGARYFVTSARADGGGTVIEK